MIKMKSITSLGKAHKTCLKRNQLKCKENSKAQNMTLDFGVFQTILKEVVVFITYPNQWIEGFLLVVKEGSYMSKNLENRKHKAC